MKNPKEFTDADEILMTNPNQKVHWVETESKLEFNLSFMEVIFSEYRLNRYFIGNDECTLNEFLCMLAEWDPTCKDPELISEGMDVGWSTWAYEPYGYKWIDFLHTVETRDDGTQIFYINYMFEPHGDYQLDPDDMLPVDMPPATYKGGK